MFPEEKKSANIKKNNNIEKCLNPTYHELLGLALHELLHNSLQKEATVS
jgi:hypothetical protein